MKMCRFFTLLSQCFFREKAAFCKFCNQIHRPCRLKREGRTKRKGKEQEKPGIGEERNRNKEGGLRKDE